MIHARYINVKKLIFMLHLCEGIHSNPTVWFWETDKASPEKQNKKISLIYDIVPSIFIFNLLTHIILESQAFRVNS
jgi:hypothetical protein